MTGLSAAAGTLFTGSGAEGEEIAGAEGAATAVSTFAPSAASRAIFK